MTKMKILIGKINFYHAVFGLIQEYPICERTHIGENYTTSKL